MAPPLPPLLGPPLLHLPEWSFSNYPITYTENTSPTFVTTGNPFLDFFFHVVPDTPPRSLKHRLCSAWNHDPLTTLKLVFNLRGVRGTGKSDTDGFYTAELWLHQNHPKTLAANVGSIAGFGYLKDLPEILCQLVQGPDKRDHEKKPETSRLRKVKRLEMARKALDKYSDDPNYRFLFERISDYFAEHLKNDMKLYVSGEFRKVSLAAKWCPSLDYSHDRVTLICESIAKKVFPKEMYPEYEGIEEAHYAYRVRDRLRKQVLVPLRKVLELPEVYIGANRWDSIPYNRVASVAMSLYKNKFLKHDRARFTKYLEGAKAEKTKINAGSLLPHLIVTWRKR
ncbi:hypothetical protein LWI28_026751 [Acer negundo]|uniref:DUF2828 domain-containing protein n=1 Tax=Acer negundo TaxID=4023 RepID=A0AAD5NP37_ACENE|nr:hypothetical protein LWI28_026751 [Acer negundo]